MNSTNHIFCAIDIITIIAMIALYTLRFKRIRNISILNPYPEFEYSSEENGRYHLPLVRREDLDSSSKHVLLKDGTIWIAHYNKEGYFASATRGHTNETFVQYKDRITLSIESDNLRQQSAIVKEMVLIGLCGNVYFLFRIIMMLFG